MTKEAKTMDAERSWVHRFPWPPSGAHSPSGLLFQTWILILATGTLFFWLNPVAPYKGEQRLSLMGSPLRSMDLVQDGAMTYALVLGIVPGDSHERLSYLESEDRGQTFGPPSFIDLHDETVISNRANSVRLITAGSQRIAVYQIKGKFPGNGPLRVAVSKDNGLHWTSGIRPVTGDALENQGYPSIKVDGKGIAHLFWLDDREEEGSSAGLRAVSSRDGGLTWQNERTLDDHVCTCCSVHAADLPNSSVGLLYRDHAPKNMRLGILNPSQKEWHQMSRVGAYDWHFEGCPHMGSGLQGQWLKNNFILHAAIWTGAESRQGIHYLRSLDLGSSWEDDLLIDEVGADPDLVTTDEGRIAIAYRQGLGTDGRIIVRVSDDAGLHWRAPQVIGSRGVRVERPKLIADATGLTVVWTESSEINGRRLRLQPFSWIDVQ